MNAAGIVAPLAGVAVVAWVIWGNVDFWRSGRYKKNRATPPDLSRFSATMQAESMRPDIPRVADQPYPPGYPAPGTPPRPLGG